MPRVQTVTAGLFLRTAPHHPAIHAKSPRLSHGRSSLHIPPLPRQKWHVVCCKVFWRRTTYNTCRVFCCFHVVFRFPLYCLVFSCSVLPHLYSYFFFSFLFILSFLRVAPCDEERHPVYRHHAVGAFFFPLYSLVALKVSDTNEESF